MEDIDSYIWLNINQYLDFASKLALAETSKKFESLYFKNLSLLFRNTKIIKADRKTFVLWKGIVYQLIDNKLIKWFSQKFILDINFLYMLDCTGILWTISPIKKGQRRAKKIGEKFGWLDFQSCLHIGPRIYETVDDFSDSQNNLLIIRENQVVGWELLPGSKILKIDAATNSCYYKSGPNWILNRLNRLSIIKNINFQYLISRLGVFYFVKGTNTLKILGQDSLIFDEPVLELVGQEFQVLIKTKDSLFIYNEIGEIIKIGESDEAEILTVDNKFLFLSKKEIKLFNGSWTQVTLE